MVDGIYLNAISLSGLHKLRVGHFRHMNIKRIYLFTLNQADNFEAIDLSNNRLEQMTSKQLSKMFTTPLKIRKLNVSFCDLGELSSDFL